MVHLFQDGGTFSEWGDNGVSGGRNAHELMRDAVNEADEEHPGSWMYPMARMRLSGEVEQNPHPAIEGMPGLPVSEVVLRQLGELGRLGLAFIGTISDPSMLQPTSLSGTSRRSGQTPQP